MPKTTEEQFEEALDGVIDICNNLNHPEAWKWVVCYLARANGVSRLNSITAAAIQRDVEFVKESYFKVDIDTPEHWSQEDFAAFITGLADPTVKKG